MTTLTPTPAIHCQALTLEATQPTAWWRRAPRQRVLDQCALNLPVGSVTGLIGRNGAGKSSLIRCLLGLTPVSEGQAQLLGEDSAQLSDAVRARLGYVPQSPELFGWMTGQEHAEVAASLYPGHDRAWFEQLAERFALPLQQKADELAQGDQQKLALALALAHHPTLLLLDEPVASLDPLARRAFLRTLFELPERDGEGDAPPRTVLISSHLLGDLERVVSHVCFMQAGQVQLMDEWDALLEHLRLHEVSAAIQHAAVRHSRATAQGWQLLVDQRRTPPPALAQGGRGLCMDELFDVLNG